MGAPLKSSIFLNQKTIYSGGTLTMGLFLAIGIQILGMYYMYGYPMVPHDKSSISIIPLRFFHQIMKNQ